MRKKYEIIKLKFTFKHIKRFINHWMSSVIVFISFISSIQGQWTNGEESKDFYNGGSYDNPYQGSSSVPTINGYGATVRHINGYNVLDLEQINRDGNFQRFMANGGTSGFGSSFGQARNDADSYADTYNGGIDFGSGNDNSQSIGYGGFRTNNMNGFYGRDNTFDMEYNNNNNFNNNGNNNRECFGNNIVNCPSPGNGFNYNFGAVGRNTIAPDNNQQVSDDFQGAGVMNNAFNQLGGGYGSFIESQGFVGDGMPYMQNYGITNNNDGGAYGGMMSDNSYNRGYGSNFGFMNNNQINNANYYEIPSEFDMNDNTNNGNNDNSGFNAQNMKKYAEYLELINKKYGIGMPERENNKKENNAVEKVNNDRHGDTTDSALSFIGGTDSNVGQGTTGQLKTAVSNAETTSTNDHLGSSGAGVVTSDGCEKRPLAITDGSSSNGGYGSLQSNTVGTGTSISTYAGDYQSQSSYGNGDTDQWRSLCTNSYSSGENNSELNNYGSSYSGNANNIAEEQGQRQPSSPASHHLLSPGSIQALTQQIRRLPSVFYLHSTDTEAVEEEQLLRKTYGLPLVAFYVDKMEQPRSIEKNLEQLTAFTKMPYLFICGTFIGSKEHINTYHRNKQIPQLVEFVCSKNKTNRKVRRKKKRLEANKSSKQ